MKKDCTTCKYRYTDVDTPRCRVCYSVTYDCFGLWEEADSDRPSVLPTANRLWHYMDQQNIPVPVRYRIIELAQGKE